ncbi:MAG: TRAP transporter small permease [Pseudomonadota bacterium]
MDPEVAGTGRDGGPDPVSRFIERLFLHLAGACLAALFVVMLAGAVLRYLPVQTSIEHWAPGLLNLFQVWLVLFGTVAAAASRSHLRIGFLVDRLSARARRGVGAAVWCVRVATLALILQASFRVVEANFSASIGGVPFTKGHIYAVLPVVLTVLILLEAIRAALRLRERAS